MNINDPPVPTYTLNTIKMPLLPGKYSLRFSQSFILTRTTVAVYGLEVPCGDIMVPAIADFPATVSIFNYLFCDSYFQIVVAGSGIKKHKENGVFANLHP